MGTGSMLQAFVLPPVQRRDTVLKEETALNCARAGCLPLLSLCEESTSLIRVTSNSEPVHGTWKTQRLRIVRAIHADTFCNVLHKVPSARLERWRPRHKSSNRPGMGEAQTAD